jgi:hypothetical protein
MGSVDGDGNGVRNALKRKDQVMMERGERVGGSPARGGSASGGGKKEQGTVVGENEG